MLESDREIARPLQKEVGLVWNIDVLWDLWGAVHEIYKLLPPVATYTFCCGVTLFLFKAVSENKQNTGREHSFAEQLISAHILTNKCGIIKVVVIQGYMTVVCFMIKAPLPLIVARTKV